MRRVRGVLWRATDTTRMEGPPLTPALLVLLTAVAGESLSPAARPHDLHYHSLMFYTCVYVTFLNTPFHNFLAVRRVIQIICTVSYSQVFPFLSLLIYTDLLCKGDNK